MTQHSELPVDIDPVSVQRIAEDYGLDGDVLAEKLPMIAYGASTLLDRKNEPDTDEVNRHIEGMRNAAATLSKKINTVPRVSFFHSNLFHRYKKLYMLNNDLAELITILDDLDPTGWKEKNPTTAFRNSLIYQLAQLWKSETGKRPTGSEKPGKFLAFMTECADLCGIDSAPLSTRFHRLRKQNKGSEFEI